MSESTGARASRWGARATRCRRDAGKRRQRRAALPTRREGAPAPALPARSQRRSRGETRDRGRAVLVELFVRGPRVARHLIVDRHFTVQLDASGKETPPVVARHPDHQVADMAEEGHPAVRVPRRRARIVGRENGRLDEVLRRRRFAHQRVGEIRQLGPRVRVASLGLEAFSARFRSVPHPERRRYHALTTGIDSHREAIGIPWLPDTLPCRARGARGDRSTRLTSLPEAPPIAL